MKKNQTIAILVVGMSLGTAWAARGNFGHEQGAAWAGGIGALALIFVSQRKDWYKKTLLIALSSAFGWGATGMISYGIVVGYGRSDNFPNTLYGLLMLFVIGGLFGLLGGGLTGLSLESSEGKKVQWPGLLAQMIAGGLLVYGLLVKQLEILMTPPRNETWAICLGASMAMMWYMARKSYTSALRLAFITGLGAGFGFAFGNFLQTLGNVLEIKFNMWNVMEYSIGFFGGTALAYGVFSSTWPKDSPVPEKWESKLACIALFAIIPFIVFKESLQYSVMLRKLDGISNKDMPALASSLFASATLIIGAVAAWLRTKKIGVEKKDAAFYFILLLSLYIAISYVSGGIFAGLAQLNTHLYVVNLLVILFLANRLGQPFFENRVAGPYPQRLFFILLLAVTVIIALSIISVNIHGGLNGAHDRF